jgi:hypothetical protein
MKMLKKENANAASTPQIFLGDDMEKGANARLNAKCQGVDCSSWRIL